MQSSMLFRCPPITGLQSTATRGRQREDGNESYSSPMWAERGGLGGDVAIRPRLIDEAWENSIDSDLDFCSSGDEVLFTVELQTDEHVSDVSWELHKVITPTT